MRYWFMRMKQGKSGPDYTKELWTNGRVGVFFGTWQMKHVLGTNGEVDAAKLRAEVIERHCPQPKDEYKFTDTWLAPARKFLLEMRVGERVLVLFDERIHIGTIGAGFVDGDKQVGSRKEYIKCRPVHSCKSFAIADLPSVYRLIATIGQGAIQQIHGLAQPVARLDALSSSSEVRASFATLSPEDFLEMLAPDQWEVLCGEYLRNLIGFRFLLLQSGKTLKSFDLVGVDRNHRRILVQCKNDAGTWTGQRIASLMNEAAVADADVLYFCCRGGTSERVDDRYNIVDGNMMSAWLRSQPTYFDCLKTF